MVGHRLYGDGHAQCLGGGQNVRQTAAEQLLRFLAGRTGRLLFHAGRLGADAPGTQRLADGQLALEVRRILQTALIVDGQLHVGSQHGHLNAVRLFGGDGPGDQRVGHVRIADGRHTLFIGQLHSGKAVGGNAPEQLVRAALAVVVQAGTDDKFRHSVPSLLLLCGQNFRVGQQ